MLHFRGGNMNFFSQRWLCSKECSRTDYSCVRFPPTSLLARKAARRVGWLPAKVKRCVDKVVILKTYFFFYLCVFHLFCQYLWCQAGVSVVIPEFPQYFPFTSAAAGSPNASGPNDFGVSKHFLQQNMAGEWKIVINWKGTLNITNTR